MPAPGPKNKRLRVFLRYGGNCGYCGEELDADNFTIDHIQATDNDGGNEIENLMPACKTCNSRKGNLDLTDYRELMAYRRCWLHFKQHYKVNMTLKITRALESELGVTWTLPWKDTVEFHFEGKREQ